MQKVIYGRFVFLFNKLANMVAFFIAWVIVFSGVVGLFWFSDSAAALVLHTADPLVDAINWLFWTCLPIDPTLADAAHKVTSSISSTARALGRFISPKVDIAVSLTFNGFLSITLIAWGLHLFFAFWLNNRMRKKLEEHVLAEHKLR